MFQRVTGSLWDNLEGEATTREERKHRKDVIYRLTRGVVVVGFIGFMLFFVWCVVLTNIR